MKKLVLTLSIIFMAILANGQQVEILSQEQLKELTKEVQINHEMIKKFNKSTWSEESIDFSTISSTYSFSDIKLLIKGYADGELNLSEPNFEHYLTEAKNKMEKERMGKNNLAKGPSI